MAQDVWQFGVPEDGPAPRPDQDGERGPARRTALALIVSLTLLAALIGGLVLYIAPWANAAGGCGGG